MKKIRISDMYRNPIIMAVGVIILLCFCQLLFLLLGPLLSELIDERSPWVVSVAMMLFYILFNSISTFSSDKLIENWGRSIYGFMLLAGVGYLLAWLISGKTLTDLDGFKDIILIVLIGFMVLKTIATTIMLIVLFTKKRDAEKK